MNNNNVIQVSESVKWIGALDFDIVTFDVVMETVYGTTYNSYFIDADKKAIVDTVKEKYWDAYLEKIKSVTKLTDIEYIIVNHTEPDHSGSLRNLLKVAPNAIVVGSGNAIRYLKDIMGAEFPHMIIKHGQTLDLGNKSVQFVGAPNLHWPDSIYSYLPEEQVLFTCDSFGSHFCHEEMFDDKVGNFDDAFKYYFDVILKPFSKFILRAIDRIRPLGIKVVCPGHGPILRSFWKKYVDLSEELAREAMKYPEAQRVFIPYVSAYHKTGVIAEKIAEGIREAGDIEVEVCDIEKSSLGELEEQITRSSAILIGSPTINQNILLPIYKLFALINPLRDKGKLAAAFGSYGWSGENKRMIETNIANLKLNLFGEGIFVKFTPNEEEEKKCIDFGKAFGKALLEKEEEVSAE
ncbi:MAG: FprA family A-type flavoprotein [Bacteroidales bacterium]|nr:FprA family A-type flavoprotein [Bacteroidales bacterium]MCF8403039.1 FprA family A-type flavoprotein [Bacteroidales bacterium]